MSENDSKQTVPFAEEYWQEDGGHKWVEYIDETEIALQVFSDKLLDKANPSSDEIVLDVGCGGGANSIEIARRVGQNGRVTGIDISTAILEIAQTRGEQISNLEFINSDAATADLGEGIYDLVFSRFGVMFFSDPVQAFSNLRSALKPSGRIVFLCWRSMEENPWMNVPAQAAFSIVPPQGPPPSEDAPGPFSMASSERVKRLLTDAGLQTINMEAMDVDMKLGGIDDAVDYFMKMGPAAAALMEADEARKQAAAKAIHDALKQFETDAGIQAPAAAWIVTAS